MTADMFVGKYAVRAFFYPVDGVLAASRPKEAHPDTEQRFVGTEMAANGAAVEYVEDKSAHVRWDDDQEEGMA